MWKQDVWQEIRRRISCLDIAPGYGYHPNSGGFIPCPFHRETEGSCKLYPGDGGYHCFGCGAHGDVIDFAAKATGLSRIDAARDLNQRYSLGLELGHESNRPRRYDVAAYTRRLEEAEKAVQDMDVRRLLDLIKQHRVAYYEQPPRHILDTGDLELIRRYMVGNVYAVGGPKDYGQPAQEHHSVKPVSKWDVWLHTIHKHGQTFGEELDDLIAVAGCEGRYTPLKQWKARLDAGLLPESCIQELSIIISDELKEFDHE